MLIHCEICAAPLCTMQAFSGPPDQQSYQQPGMGSRPPPSLAPPPGYQQQPPMQHQQAPPPYQQQYNQQQVWLPAVLACVSGVQPSLS